MALTQISTQGIKDGTITNADLNASAAIARTKLANVDLVDDTSPQLGGNLDTNGNLVIFPDSNGTTNRLLFGTNKFQMYYNSGNSRMQIDNITGDFTIRNLASGGDIDIIAGDDIRIRPQGGENGINLVGNGAVELYYNNSKKFETTSTGIKTTGNVAANETIVQVLHANETQGVGTGFNGLHMIGSNTNVEMTLRSKGSGDIKLQSSANEDMAIFTPDGAVELYHNNIQAARTETNGFSVLGGEGSDANLYLFADEADDLADQWNITALAASSTFKIRNRNTNASYDTNLVCKGDGAVELYHDNSKKFETTSTGVALTGNLELAGAGGNVSTNWDNAAWEKVIFDASYNTNPQGPNKIVLQNDTSWKAGFGISSNEVGMYSGGNIVLYSKTTDSTASTKETLAKFIADGAVELYYDNSKKFNTSSTGVYIT
jgi:hypothetical protein